MTYPWLSPLLRGLWVVAVVGLCATALPEVVALGHGVLAVMLVTIATITLFCFTRPGRFWLLLYPALLVVALTVLIPIGHTAWLSTTNYSSKHLLGFEQARNSLLQQNYRIGDRYQLRLATTANGDTILRLWRTADGVDGQQQAIDENQPADFHSGPVELLTPQMVKERRLSAEPMPYVQQPLALFPGPGPAAEMPPRRALFHHREHLRALHLTVPSPQGHKLLLSDATAGVGTYTETAARYQQADSYAPGALRDVQLQQYLLPDWEIGVYQRVDDLGNAIGKPSTPAFKVSVGLSNYLRLFTAPGIAKPLGQSLVWTLCYALTTTLLAALLASINTWAIAASRHPRLWLGLLVVPAAVPAVILIPAFKGLFNQNSGELNLLFEQTLGLRFDWFSTPSLTKVMLVLTALWLLVPLLTLWWVRLCDGLLSQRWWPLVRGLWPRAKAPLLMILNAQLLAFTAISLHTGGRPDIIGSTVPAGTTDTLTSMGFRIAFEGGGGQDYGLTSALACLLIPVAVALGWWRKLLLASADRQLGQEPLSISPTRPPIAPMPFGHYPRRSQQLWLIAASFITWVPMLALLYISLRQGNFAYFDDEQRFHGATATLDHWKLTFGMAVTESDGGITPPPFPVLNWFGNSLLVALGTTLAVLAIALPAARALARCGQPHWLMRLLISLQLVTPALLLVSYYSISDQIWEHWRYLGLNSHGGLVLLLLPALLLTLPPLVATFSRSPQWALWPSLRHHWRPVAAVGLLTLLLQLGEYPLSSLIITDASKYTAALGMQQYLYSCNYLWGDFAAAALLFSLPVMLLFYLLIPLVNRDLINHWRPL